MVTAEEVEDVEGAEMEVEVEAEGVVVRANAVISPSTMGWGSGMRRTGCTFPFLLFWSWGWKCLATQ